MPARRLGHRRRAGAERPAGGSTSANPARLDDVVAEVPAGRRGAASSRPARTAQRRPARLGRHPRAGARPGDRAHRPARRGQQGGAGRAGHPRDRQAVRRGAAARSRRSSTPATSSSARAGGSTARPCPARCPTSSCSPSGCRSGVAAIVTAGNFPVAVPSWYLVPALLCGNAVVWKPAEYAAAIATRVHRAVRRGRAARRRAEHRARRRPGHVRRAVAPRSTPAWCDKVGFTGSSAVGARIGELAGRHLQTPCLELGGKNPLVVMPDADLDLAVEGALFSGFGTAGQRCTSLGTVIVHESVHDEFLARFDAAVRGAAVGDPTDDVLYGPMSRRGSSSASRSTSRWIEPHHTLHGSTGTGRITADNPRDGFVGDLERASTTTRRRRRRAPRATRCSAGDVRADRRRGHVPHASTRRSSWPTRPATGCPRRSTPPTRRTRSGSGERVSAGMVSVNNSTSGAEAHLPFGGNGRSGNGSPAVRRVGARPVHPLAERSTGTTPGQLQKAQMDTPDLPADLDFRLG